jgi:hypothetical protein
MLHGGRVAALIPDEVIEFFLIYLTRSAVLGLTV